jgi:hypothetical protein
MARYFEFASDNREVVKIILTEIMNQTMTGNNIMHFVTTSKSLNRRNYLILSWPQTIETSYILTISLLIIFFIFKSVHSSLDHTKLPETAFISYHGHAEQKFIHFHSQES